MPNRERRSGMSTARCARLSSSSRAVWPASMASSSIPSWLSSSPNSAIRSATSSLLPVLCHSSEEFRRALAFAGEILQPCTTVTDYASKKLQPCTDVERRVLAVKPAASQLRKPVLPATLSDCDGCPGCF